jgi:magnesium transporter
MVSGVLLGLILGSLGFVRIALWAVAFDAYGPHWLLMALTVASRCSGWSCGARSRVRCCRSCSSGSGADPATSSAPFIATLVDVTGIIIFFTIAMVFLSGTLL